MIITECRQYSPEWWTARRGVPTASEFGRIITPAKGELCSKHFDYARRLIADKYDVHYGQRDGYYSGSRAMESGTLFESEARRFYMLEADCDVQEVGFCRTDDERFGCSPDGLMIDAGGCLEIKSPEPATHLEWLLKGGLPDDHKAQCHGHLIVTGLEWCDFMSYCAGFPALRVRVVPDDFTAKLRIRLEEFWEIYVKIEQRVENLINPQHETPGANPAISCASDRRKE